jgi:hypothetical protein
MAYENNKEEVTIPQVLFHLCAVITILLSILWACVMFAKPKENNTLSQDAVNTKYGLIDIQTLLNNAKKELETE